MAEKTLWLIEAAGPLYLSTRCVATWWEFYWTSDHDKAIGFQTEDQCNGVMKALQTRLPGVFVPEALMQAPRAVEHMWVDGPDEGVKP